MVRRPFGGALVETGSLNVRSFHMQREERMYLSGGIDNEGERVRQ